MYQEASKILTRASIIGRRHCCICFPTQRKLCPRLFSYIQESEKNQKFDFPYICSRNVAVLVQRRFLVQHLESIFTYQNTVVEDDAFSGRHMMVSVVALFFLIMVFTSLGFSMTKFLTRQQITRKIEITVKIYSPSKSLSYIDKIRRREEKQVNNTTLSWSLVSFFLLQNLLLFLLLCNIQYVINKGLIKCWITIKITIYTYMYVIPRSLIIGPIYFEDDGVGPFAPFLCL